MGFLTESEIADLRADFIRGEADDDWFYRKKVDGVFGAWIPIKVAETAFTQEQETDDEHNVQWLVKVATLRPLEDVTLRTGDQVSPDNGATIYVLRRRTGASLPRWDAVQMTNLGVGTTENEFIAEGSGAPATPVPPLQIFTTQWKTDNAGASANDAIALPLESTGAYNFVVDWGDGNQDTITVWNQAETTHVYAVAGTYNVTITGQCEGWRFNNGGDDQKLLNISTWGAGFKILNDAAFWGCVNLTITATDILQLATTSMMRMFRECDELIDVPNIGQWDVSLVTDFEDTFRGSEKFNADVGDWTLTNATNFNSMFEDCHAFNQDISGWDVFGVTIMSDMFLDAEAFNQDISGWDVRTVTSFSSMFEQTLAFNQDLTSWDVSAATSLFEMFRDAKAFNQSLNWNTINVTNTSSMFRGASAFNGTITFKTQNVTNMDSMFRDCTIFDSPVNFDDTGKVTDMEHMFRSAVAWDQASAGGFDVTALTLAQNMFNGATLSTVNYDALLVAWEAQAVNNNVNFHGGNSKYTDPGAGATARAALIADHTWTITDGGAV